jgi:gliding motility-associated-like protein
VEHNDKIKDLFSEKLGNFESSVRPELWSNITSQIGATTTVTTVSTGVSLFTKTIIGVSVAAALSGLGYFAWNKEHQQADKNDTQVNADKSISKENNVVTSSNTANEKIQRNANKNNGSSINQSFVPSISDFVLPTTEDFIDLLLENKELPIPTIQLAETNLPESVEEPKQENIGIQVDHSTEIVDNFSNSTPLPEIVKVDLELPNVFTPNNDGANDYFEIKSNGLTDFSLVVLDMNGKPVYQTTDANFKWDGMNLSNEKVKDGNYLYYLTAKDSEGKMISKSQSLRITTER